jgi:hypothetical protein
MISKMRVRVTYANVVATLALMLAMTGGAYAAGKYIITSSKQISPKVLKGLKGKNGTNGKNGSNGSNGVNGKDGAQGVPGEKGAPGEGGAVGASGKDGASVTSTELSQGNAHCKEGGSEFAAGSKKSFACNGSPWVAGGTLPKGATETGTWAVESTAAATEEHRTAVISFPIPLGGAVNVNFIPPETTPPAEKCEGDVEKPGAKPGQLCIFEGNAPEALGQPGGLESLNTIVSPDGELSVGPTGGQLVFLTTQTGRVTAEGTWAVTG